MVATKLKMEKFREWASNELHGYPDKAELPKYRKVGCQLRVRNPYRGLQPIVFEDAAIGAALEQADVRQPIGGLAKLMLSDEKGGHITYSMPPSVTRSLIKIQEDAFGIALEPLRIVPFTSIAAILDAVRTTVLEWALKLENEGIMGEGLSFSDSEKARANAAHVQIESFQGVFGNITHSTVTQQLSMEVKQNDLATLRQYLSANSVSKEDIKELEGAIEGDPAPPKKGAFGSGVSSWMGKMVAKAASGAWNASVDAAGTILGKALRGFYGMEN